MNEIQFKTLGYIGKWKHLVYDHVKYSPHIYILDLAFMNY